MKNTYSIWIVSPPDLVWSHVFDEAALALQSAFAELGYQAPVVTDARQAEGRIIVFGANLCPMYNIALPEDCIIFNLEQVHPGSRWFHKQYGYIEMLKSRPVWDYSKQNIEALKGFGVEDIVHCGIGYAKELTRIAKGKEDVDVVFIGGNHPRRQAVLDSIGKAGMRLQHVYKLFGAERDQWIARGKIHLNMHKEPAQLFEIVRVSYLLANKAFVISEKPQDAEMVEAFRDGVVFCEYGELANTCRYYLERPAERKKIAEAGFKIFSQMRQKDYLEKALAEHQRLHAEHKKPSVIKGPVRATGELLPRIFVAVASFRDTEITPTLTDLFAKAAHPDRIRVGVCLQIDAKEDAGCTIDPALRPQQIGIRQVDWRESKGANWARDQALQLMKGEEYVLIMDSHMRFEPGWDETLVDMLARCPSEKPVISGYIPDYKPPNIRDYQAEHMLRIKIRRLGAERDPQLVHVTGVFVFFADERGSTLYPTPFCVFNFIFTRKQTLQEVPLDPHIHFWGDEIDFAARLWTHGYDIFQPDRVVLFHCWVRESEFYRHQYREHFNPANARSMARVRHLLGFGLTRDKAALAEIEQYGLGDRRELNDLWAFAGINWKKRDIAKDAQEGIWNMAARDKALGKAEKKAKPVTVNDAAPQEALVKETEALPRIFVMIAAYRDPDCQWTVKDMFEKAAHPERIHVGICWQFNKAEDKHCFREPYPYPEQVRVIEVEASESKGVCWARSQVQGLWQGEEFVMQIDSHMRFEPGWDEMLLGMWEECGTEKAVLTCYPPGFIPPNKYERKFIFGMSAKHFDPDGIFLMIGGPIYEVGKNEPAAPTHGAFASANMLFGPSSIIRDVPYDPHLYFFGEEITLAARLWTHGYEIFHPNRLFIFHDWNRNKRPTHFADYADWKKLNDPSYERVRHLLGVQRTTNMAAIRELDKYGLGRVRSLADYQKFSGVNFEQRTITQDALKGKFPPFEKKGAKAAEQPKTEKPSAQKPKAPAIVKQVSLSKKQEPKIFINIASYRDPECQWTVKDMFDKARNPDRINAGICWQFDPAEDQHCFEVSTRPEQVRMHPVDWREAEGVCWARHHTQQLWDGEDYTLMTDSHMRFVPGWDELMIQELAECEADKPLLSCSPVNYTPPNNLGTRMNPTIRRVKPFQADGNIRCHGEMLDRRPEKPLKGAFVVANFIFSRSEITPEVPYDPYLYFDQEEISYAARLYTHGWDVFSSRSQFLYHYYNDGSAPTGSVRPLHWRDLRKEDEKRIAFMRDRGLKRFNHLTGHKASSDPDVLKELELYGFGRERSFTQFEQYSGIDFKNKIATERALRCQFIDDLQKYRDRPIWVPELDDPKLKAAHAVSVNGGTNGHANGHAAAPKLAPHVAQAQQAAPEAKAAPKTAKMMEPGDYLPMCELEDTNKKVRAVEVYGGKYTLMAYLPASDPELVKRFMAEMEKQVNEKQLKDVWQFVVLDEHVDKLIEMKEKHGIGQVFHGDAGRRLGHAMGIAKPGEASFLPAGFVINQNLKIEHRHIHTDPAKLAEAMVHDCMLEKARFAEKQTRTISEVAPTLIVPNALSKELCARLIHAFRTGRTFEGTVGAEAAKAYRPDAKIRTDFIVEGGLLDEVDDKLSRSLFPEIKKVFGFDVVARELYKVGLYVGEKKGFFKQHRDNFDVPLGYRHLACTIQLNDEYEGGGLRFPEYGDDLYRPSAGGAITFSCGTLHEAMPVTKGERFVLVCFFHGPEDEAFRQHYATAKGHSLKLKDYLPALRDFSGLRKSRAFFEKWQKDNVRYNADAKKDAAPAAAVAPANNAVKTEAPRIGILVKTIGMHQPKKVFESKSGIVFDDFLPEDVFEKLSAFALTTDYERINTHGKSTRAWHVHDGFPLRTCKNYFYHAEGFEKPKGDHIFPTNTPIDRFVEHMLAMQPYVEHMIGKQGEKWAHFSVTGWIYPHGTGLSMHDDGSGVYTGAYAYFMNPQWRPHWGGLLLLVDPEGNDIVHSYRSKVNQMDYYQRKWLHANPLDEMLMDYGFARCIMPKRNRIVFIANNAYHMVTRVNEQCGDNVRMSLAGFYNYNKPKK